MTFNNTGGSAGQICKTHLHVLLNRDNEPNLDDYVYYGCMDKTKKGFFGGPKKSEGDKKAKLAQSENLG